MMLLIKSNSTLPCSINNPYVYIMLEGVRGVKKIESFGHAGLQDDRIVHVLTSDDETYLVNIDELFRKGETELGKNLFKCLEDRGACLVDKINPNSIRYGYFKMFKLQNFPFEDKERMIVLDRESKIHLISREFDNGCETSYEG